MIEGSRKFTLINPKWDEPHHVIFLNRAMGALQIPIGTYHRSESGKEGSILLNKVTSDNGFDQTKELSPVSLRSNKQFKKARQAHPVYWIWEEERIKRVKLDCKGFIKKTKLELIVAAHQ